MIIHLAQYLWNRPTPYLKQWCTGEVRKDNGYGRPLAENVTVYANEATCVLCILRHQESLSWKE